MLVNSVILHFYSNVATNSMSDGVVVKKDRKYQLDKRKKHLNPKYAKRNHST